MNKTNIAFAVVAVAVIAFILTKDDTEPVEKKKPEVVDAVKKDKVVAPVVKKDKVLKTAGKIKSKSKSQGHLPEGYNQDIYDGIQGVLALREASRERMIRAFNANDTFLFERKLDLTKEQKAALKDLLADRVFFEQNAKKLIAKGLFSAEEINKALELALAELAEQEQTLLEKQYAAYEEYVDNRINYQQVSFLQKGLKGADRLNDDQFNTLAKSLREIDEEIPYSKEIRLMDPVYSKTVSQEVKDKFLEDVNTRTVKTLEEASEHLSAVQLKQLEDQLAARYKIIKKYLH